MELCEKAIRSGLFGNAKNWRLEVLPTAASTNALARDAGAAGAAEGLVILAGEQTAGRAVSDAVFSPREERGCI